MRPSMHMVLITAATLVASNPLDLPANFSQLASLTAGISWERCADTNRTIQCGRFEVPLDYRDSRAGKASLAVARYPATKEPKKGTLFLNPGGPGASGVDMILSDDSITISAKTGGYYDLVSWDPRGVGLTYPRVKCFETVQEENAFWEGTLPASKLEVRGNFTDRADLDAFFAQVPKLDELLGKLATQCTYHSQGTLQYMGTAATVRDMVALHDYIESSHTPINYWGSSYGSAIGLYFVNMLPSRVGHVVLDGVVDPVYYANLPPHKSRAEAIQSADKAFMGFVQACVSAGPSRCALAKANSTVDSLVSDIWSLIDNAYDFNKAAGGETGYSSAQIRNLLFGFMYQPTEWPLLAKTLSGMAEYISEGSNQMKRSIDVEELGPQPFFHKIPLAQSFPSKALRQLRNWSYHAITCADAVDAEKVTTQMVFEEVVRTTREVSPMFGPTWGDTGYYCHRWPIRAVGRYTGPWNQTLSNQILVIGNNADPITPFSSAKKVADALGDSAVLVHQGGYGHTSSAMHSCCTNSIIERYFANDQPPPADQFCNTDQILFPALDTNSSPGSGSCNLSTIPSKSNGELKKANTLHVNLLIIIFSFACMVGL